MRHGSAEGTAVRKVWSSPASASTRETLATLTQMVRKILDEAGCNDVPIILSGDLDEFRIARDGGRRRSRRCVRSRYATRHQRRRAGARRRL